MELLRCSRFGDSNFLTGPYWNVDGIPHEAGDGGANHSFSRDISPLGRMVGTTATTMDELSASFVDVASVGSHQFLPEKNGFTSGANGIF